MPPPALSPQTQWNIKDVDALHQHLRPGRQPSRPEERLLKSQEIPNRIRNVLLVNKWLPCMLYVPYLAWEASLRHSPRMRDRWSEQRRIKSRRNSKKPPQTLPYQSLDFDDSIRLLHLLPGENENPICCSITHHRLSEQPNYTAVSYSWIADPDLKPTSMKCGQNEMVVENTIVQLLKRLRRKDESVALWIDAICINQADPKERGSQVEMMDQIYSCASLVVIWVGEADDRTARSARFIDQIIRDIESGEGAKSNTIWRLGLEWTDLALFLERPWFTRTWVLQEVCLARNCLLRCGPYFWSWDTLQQVFDNLIASGTGDAPGVGRKLNRGVIQFGRNWRFDKSRGEDTLAQLLQATRGTFASVPVDKVYAILSLADNRLGIHVEYDKSVQHVFNDVARRLISKGAPELLAIASDNIWNNTPGLPTWVPDWACMEKPTSLRISWQGDLEPISEVLKAELLTTDNATARVEGRLLRLLVSKTDRVRAIGVPWAGNGHEKNAALTELFLWEISNLGIIRLEQWHSMLPHLLQGNQCTYGPTGEHRVAALMQTIVANSTTLPTCCLTWEAVYTVFRERLRWLRRISPRAFNSAFLKIEDPMADYHNAVKAMCHKRTLFFTKGGYMGLGPFNTLPFDRICVVPGLYLPMVMRKMLKGRYKLIGECYLHGWTRPNNLSELIKLETIQ